MPPQERNDINGGVIKDAAAEGNNANVNSNNNGNIEHDARENENKQSLQLKKNNGNDGTTDREKNPFLQASLFSKSFFNWPYPLLKLGMERTLEESDLPDIMKEESSSFNRNYFETIWFNELKRVEKINNNYPKNSNKEKIKPDLRRALVIDFFKSTWIIQPLMCLSSTARIIMAVALGNLTQSFIDRDGTGGYIWASVLVVCNAIVLMEHHHVFFITWRKGMNLRTGAVAAIFNKSLRLSSIGGTGGGVVSSGQIMNLVSNDVERFLITALFLAYIIWAPLQTIAVFILGLYLIGPAFAVGMGVLIFVFVPAQAYLSKRFAVVRSKVASFTDSRVTLISQAISGVRVMKMSGWEWQFQSRINKIREREVQQIRKAYRLYAVNEALFFSTNVVISLIIFAVHVVLMGGQLTTRNAFTIMSLTNVLQIELTKHLSIAVMSCSECSVSVRRIQNFLETIELTLSDGDDDKRNNTTATDVKTLESKDHSLLKNGNKPEKNNYIVRGSSSNNNDNVALSLRNASCFWDFKDGNSQQEGGVEGVSADSGTIALDDITVDLKMNELTCVVGAVGSGKSAFLLALAGELVAHKGTIEKKASSLAFANQDPWIMNGTVEENILMGLPYDKTFYNEVVRSCGLDVDFVQFNNGDKTVVGDRGVQCSGGQRARIGLARALYRDADILLLDDPLSAVDSKVGALIFYSAIRGIALKRGACVVLVTHQHQFVGQSRCLLMSNGKLQVDGSFNDCVAAANGKLDFVSHNEGDETSSKEGEEEEEKPDEDTEKTKEKETPVQEGEEVTEDVSKNDGQEEKKAKGLVSRATFMHYARSMGGWWIALWLMLLFIVSQVASLACVAMIGRWSERPFEEQRSWDILVIVMGLGLAVVVLSFVRSVAFLHQSLHASKQLHHAMTSAVLRGKIEFFDTNPSGRILNRFSADVGSNDELLPKTLFDFFSCTFIVFGSLVTAVTALPYILLTMPPLIWYFTRTRTFFVTSSREIKRFEGVARSPIFAMLSESISGVATIRANDAIQYIKDKFEVCHDTHSRAFFSFVASSRWVGFRMDSLMFITVSCSSILAALFGDRGWFEVDPVIFGLALSMLIQLGSIFQWTIRQSAEVVNLMVCVERVSEYSMVEAEGDLSTSVDKDVADWPTSGDISVRDLSIRYRSALPLSLRNVSFDIQSGKKIGVVGRTGSGKSTLVQSLFRILEAETGSIMVDGMDISTLGLHKLRMGMSVINQYPVLFSGCTIRENLDPFEQYSDDAINEALSDVQMANAVNNLPEGLQSLVAEGGSNFSVGERQLLCLARATLQKSRILVLDEPTANVDSRTDQLLQEAVKKSFPGATIVSIAHRLDTIIENDLILVLGAGQVLEFGSPNELIEKDGHFTSMVNDTGTEMSSELRRRAAAVAAAAAAEGSIS